MEKSDIEHLRNLSELQERLCEGRPLQGGLDLEWEIARIRSSFAQGDVAAASEIVKEQQYKISQLFLSELAIAEDNNRYGVSLTPDHVSAAALHEDLALERMQLRYGQREAGPYTAVDAEIAERLGILDSPEAQRLLVQEPIRALLQDVRNGVITAEHISSPLRFDALCELYYIHSEAGLLSHVNGLRAQQEALPQGQTKEVPSSPSHSGYGYLLHQRDDGVRLIFTTSESEAKLALWPSLVDAYNMKNPEHPVNIYPEQNGIYMLQAARVDTCELAELIHKGLTGLLQTAERPIPQMVEAGPELSRSR